MEKEVVWWPDEAASIIDYSLTPEENRKKYEEKKKEFVEKYPECVIYVN